jgi:hypothetical protein
MANANPNMTALSTAVLASMLPAPEARAELQRRHDKRIASGKKGRPAVMKALGIAPEAKPAAKPAAAPTPEPAPAAPEPRMFEDLSGLERHRALRAEAQRLGLATGGTSAVLEARILEAQPELLLHLRSHEEAQQWRAAKPASAPEAAPTPAPEGEVDVEQVVAGVKALVDETLKLRAEVASLKAKAATATGANRWAAIATQLARAGV